MAADDVWARIFSFIFSHVQEAMGHDIDVTDDVLARDALSGLRLHHEKTTSTRLPRAFAIFVRVPIVGFSPGRSSLAICCCETPARFAS